jgi:hypothetical protein
MVLWYLRWDSDLLYLSCNTGWEEMKEAYNKDEITIGTVEYKKRFEEWENESLKRSDKLFNLYRRMAAVIIKEFHKIGGALNE